MRILMFTNAYHPTVSGVVTSISLFRKGLIKSDQEVHLIAPDYKDYIDPEPHIFRFPAWDLNELINISLIMPIMALMAPTIQGLKPQVIYSQHPLLMGGMAAEFAEDLQVPLVFTFHTRYDEYAQQYVPIAPDLASSVAEEVIRRYLIRCSHIIAPTPSVKEMIHREYDIRVPVTIIPTPIALEEYQEVNPERIRETYGLAGHNVLLFVGRLAEEKNIPLLLKTFAQVKVSLPDTKLLMVGDGPKERALKSLANELRLGESVIFCGYVPHEEIPHYSAAANLFVFPSKTETQGLVILEALAAGTPAVAVTAPATSDILSTGGGILVEPEINQFAAAVTKLLSDSHMRETLGAEALKVAGRYAISSRTAQLISVYEQAIAAGPRSWEDRKKDDRTVFQSVRSALTYTQNLEKSPKGISADFLERIRKLLPGHLVVDLIHRLLVIEINGLKHINLALARSFTISLEKTMEAYESRSLETGQTITELISMASDLMQAEQGSAEHSIDPHTLALYDTLLSNDKLTETIAPEDLEAIAHDINALFAESAPLADAIGNQQQKKIRPQIENLLVNYDYPPELVPSVVDALMEQAAQFNKYANSN